jgi:hypothetical protein
MKGIFSLSVAALVYVVFALSSCSVQDDKPAKPAAAPPPVAKAEKAPPAEKAEKAKVEKTKGDIGLIDTEKNYMIVVTKEGKLITLDFDNKTKVIQITPTPGKIADIGLGSSATVTYTKAADKNIAGAIEYKAAKGGD